MPDGEMGEGEYMVWAGAGDGEDGEGNSSGVFIAVGGGGDFELPDEVREKLEQVAQEMAEKLMARLEEAEANGIDLADQLPGPDADGVDCASR